MTKSLKEWMTRVTNFLFNGRLQEKTVTGTTNGYGAISSGLSRDSYYICAADCTSAGYKVEWGSFGNTLYMWVYNDSSSFSPAANKSVTIRVSYRARIVGGYRIRYYRQSSVKGVA